VDTNSSATDGIITVDCRYMGQEGLGCAYLLIERGECAIVETSTAHATPLLLDALARHGLGPEAVRYLFLTHVHLDHAGGAGELLAQCPNAAVIVHPRGAIHLANPKVLVMSARRLFGEARFEQLYGRVRPVPAGRIRTVEDGEEVRLGARSLRCFSTRGHANHHLVYFDNASGALFSGDSFGAAPSFLRRGGGGPILPLTPPTEFEPVEARWAIERIVKLRPSAVYLTHHGAYHAVEEGAQRLLAALECASEAMQVARGLEPPSALAHCYEALHGHFEQQLMKEGVILSDSQRAILDAELRLNAEGLVHAARGS
jgi:glyoxylase-like metal-dependent hydrolase (beta-lactamase superfamily II)